MSGKAFVIHVNEMADYPDSVYIGRAVPRRGMKASKWANPYTVKEHGRTMAVALYALDLGEQRTYVSDVQELLALRGKPLACWCRRSDEERTEHNICHGDVLAELVNSMTGGDDA